MNDYTHTTVIGAGFSGFHIARIALTSGTVAATRRHETSLSDLKALGVNTHVLDGTLNQSLREELSRTTHLIVCVGPDRQAPLNDPVHSILGSLNSSALPALQWIGYLSTIGVYGDHAGAWIDETADCRSVQMRSLMRLEAEAAWLRFAEQLRVPLTVMRLSGIYGPGRNALEDALAGRARMLIKPDQVFNRIHVHDLARAAMFAATRLHDGIVNITDDLPAPPQDVVRFAHDLLAKPYPQAQDFAGADISEMARSFYSENKRVSNALSKSVLGLEYDYPTYKDGLTALHAAMH